MACHRCISLHGSLLTLMLFWGLVVLLWTILGDLALNRKRISQDLEETKVGLASQNLKNECFKERKGTTEERN